MKRVIPRALMLAALAFAAPVAHAAGTGLIVQPASKLWLTGTSTMHAYSSTATKLDVTFKTTAAEMPAAPTPGESIEQLIRSRGVTGLDLVIAVAGMRSGKDALDKNMRKALLAEKHPEIRFTMTGYEVAEGSTPGTIGIETHGKLTVAGVERQVDIPVTVKREEAGVRMTGEVQLLMTQFGIKPPTMMMGALKTRDPVVIHFDLKVGSASGSPTAARPDGAGQ